MKSIHINTERTWRGGEQQMCYLAAGLARRGHGAVVVARPDSPCETRARGMGLEVRPLLLRGDLDLFAAHGLARLADELEADLLHAHTSRAHLPAAMAKLFVRRPVKVVVHRRADFSIHKLPLRLSGWKYRWGVDRYIAITEAVRQIMIADGIPAGRISVVHSSTDPSRFDGIARKPGLRAELGAPEDALLIGNVAALVGHKGQRYLLDAFAQVLQEFPNAFLAIVGEGPLRADLETQAEALGIRGRVGLPGFRDDVPQCLAEFDVFCMSSWGEGMGSVVLEAMCMRLPIVVTSAGGLPEVVKDGVNGLVVPPRDPAALAEALARCLRDRDLARRLAEEGRRAVERDFTADRMVEKTLAVYEELLGRKNVVG